MSEEWLVLEEIGQRLPVVVECAYHLFVVNVTQLNFQKQVSNLKRHKIIFKRPVGSIDFPY